MKPLKMLLVVVVLATVAACGDQKYEGKTAQEWAAEASRQKPAEATPKSSAKEFIASEKQRQEEGEKKYMELAQKQAALIESSSGEPFLQAALSALRKSDVEESPGEEEILLGAENDWFNHRVMSLIVPTTAVDGVSVFYSTTQNGRGIISNAVIHWATQDQGQLDKAWVAMRPILRQQYALMKTLRRHEALFRTNYTRKGFEPLSECLTWHEGLLYATPERRVAPTPQDAKRCTEVFKKFGVKAEFGGERGEVAARNALWIVRFFARREADGGEKFAQNFQRLALDFIK